MSKSFSGEDADEARGIVLQAAEMRFQSESGAVVESYRVQVGWTLGFWKERDRITTYYVINRDQGHSVLERLRDDDAVKGITVPRRQLGQMDQCRFFDYQGGYLVGGALARQILRRRLRQRKLAESVLDDCFPHRGDTQVDVVGGVTYRVPVGHGETRIGADIPKEDLRVEQ